MMDQAENLRNIIRQQNQNSITNARVIAVTSGKGGVGKSNLSVNLALEFTRMGKKVIILDADFGLANVEVMFGVIPEYNLSDLMFKGKEIKDIITEGPEGVGFISGGSGIANLVNLDQEQIKRLVNKLSDLEALGFDSLAITQTAKELNDATVDFRLEIKAGNVVIEGTEVGKGKVVPFDELLTWSIANAKTISNSYGEIKIDKALDEDRIDPIDAIIDAWKAAMKEEYKPDTNEVVNEWLEMYEKYMGKGGEKE